MEDTIRVLIADASPEQSALLRTLLEDADITVIAAVTTGEEAYTKLQETMPDVFVTDLLLPCLDGLSLLRRLKDEGKLPRTIILSAFWNDRIARSAMHLGVDDYLPKPCRADVLQQHIRELADNGSERRCAADPVVRRALMEFHVPTHLDGYKYLCEGLARVLEDQGSLEGITKVLYREIAKVFHTNQACVEHSMRTAIVTAWKKGSAESRRLSFGPVFDGYAKAPSNLHFLSAMAEYIMLTDCITSACR